MESVGSIALACFLAIKAIIICCGECGEYCFRWSFQRKSNKVHLVGGISSYFQLFPAVPVLQKARTTCKKQYSSNPQIGATRKTGGSNRGYKPPLLTRASRRGLLLCSSLSVFVTLAAPEGAYLANGSSYSFTLSLSFAISCFSCSRMYLRIVSSFRPTVLT